MDSGLSERICCSFCGLISTKVGHMIQGPGPLYICDQCIDLANELIAEAKIQQGKSRQTVVKATASFPFRSMGEDPS